MAQVLVDANVLALQKGDGQTLNISTGQGIATAEVLSQLADILQVSCKPRYCPPRSGDIQKSILNSQRARDVLNWQATVSLTEGLTRTLESYQVHLGNLA